jgi:hypothetical protein
MNTIEKIRLTGVTVAIATNVLGNPKIEDVNLPNEIIEDFITRVKNDLFEFNYFNQFDARNFNLFARAFIYVYGKGAEFAFHNRIGNSISRIDYNFDSAMQAKCCETLPEHLRFQINNKTNEMLNIYIQMFELTKGTQEIIISEGLNFDDCISTILSGAFYLGKEVCSTLEFIGKDNFVKFDEKHDEPYDYDNYDQNYKLDDFKV